MAKCFFLHTLLALHLLAVRRSLFAQSLSASAPAPAAPPPRPNPPAVSGSPISTAVVAQAFPVSSASDLASAFSSRAALIYLMDNITLTNDVFPSNLSLTIGQTRNITITPAPTVTTTVTLDFGYFLTERVTIASSGVLNFQGLQLLNYYFPSLDATPTDTFLPFFSVLPGAIINCTAVRFQIDPTRCASSPSYANTSNTLRAPWLAAEYPELLSYHTLDNNHVQVDSARTSQSFQRINATYVVPSPGSGDIELSTCIFLCATTSQTLNVSSSNQFSDAADSDELLNQLSPLDSRTIYIENNITVLDGAWPTTLVIANYRQVLIQSALPDLPNSPGNDTMPSQLYIQDSSDVIITGYGGNLTFADIDLVFDSVCCSAQQLLGTWYVNQQPLTGSLFNDLLPAALIALPVHVLGLAPPAYLILQNVRLRFKQCDSTRFPRIANSLVNSLNSNAASNGNASYSDGHSVTCTNCLFQGTAVKPANFSNPSSYSTVQLVNTTINCASFVSIVLPPALAPTPSLAMIEGGVSQPATPTPAGSSPPRTVATPADAQQPSGFTPKAAVVAPIIVVICAVVVAVVGGLWVWLQRDYNKLQASYGQLLDQSGSSEDSVPPDVPLSSQHAAAGSSDR